MPHLLHLNVVEMRSLFNTSSLTHSYWVTLMYVLSFYVESIFKELNLHWFNYPIREWVLKRGIHILRFHSYIWLRDVWCPGTPITRIYVDCIWWLFVGYFPFLFGSIIQCWGFERTYRLLTSYSWRYLKISYRASVLVILHLVGIMNVMD